MKLLAIIDAGEKDRQDVEMHAGFFFIHNRMNQIDVIFTKMIDRCKDMITAKERERKKMMLSMSTNGLCCLRVVNCLLKLGARAHYYYCGCCVSQRLRRMVLMMTVDADDVLAFGYEAVST